MATLYDYTGTLIAEGLPSIEDSHEAMELALKESMTRRVVLENEEDEGMCLTFLKGAMGDMYVSLEAFLEGRPMF